MNRARKGPTLTQVPVDKLEILGNTAVEQETLAGIVRVDKFQCVAKLVEALFIEGVAASAGPAANSPA